MINLKNLAEKRKEAIVVGLVRDYLGGTLSWEKSLSNIAGLAEVFNLLSLLEEDDLKQREDIKTFLK